MGFLDRRPACPTGSGAWPAARLGC
jgi:hypothetical protein